MSQPLSIKEVVKKYGDFTAIDEVSLDIQTGEFFTLLGPSGCGKTTLLRMIAGFNTIESGQIAFGKQVINKIPAHQRNTGMVFQNYAIFPHLSVYDNIAYGLKARKFSAKEIDQKVGEVLDLVRMSEYKNRQPSQLSGGQQQRIALARAIVIQPEVLLMDEPLSNLDAKLRVEMRSVIKKIQKNLNITTVYVTHDQEEALAISDRIAVMNLGTIQQLGTPLEIYTRPSNTFVADFIGTSSFIDVTIKDSKVLLGSYSFPAALKHPYHGQAILAVRPEESFLSLEENEGLKATINFATFLGDFINYEVLLESGETIQVNEYLKEGGTIKSAGDQVYVTFDTEKVNIFDLSTKESLI